MAAVAIGVSMIGEQNREATRPFTLSGEAANSTTAIREAGVVVPAVEPSIGWTSTTAIRESGVTLPAVVGISHVTPLAPSTGFAGFENPGAYITQAPTYATGLENPAAYGSAWGSTGGPNEALHRQYAPPQETAASGQDPIVVNGEACMQCR
jgi:hypothetical protein